MKINRCMRCMEQFEGNSVCPHCGFENANYQTVSYALRPGSILHGKYLTGQMLGQGGFGITYIGFDLSLEIKVAIKEYFPMNQSFRDYNVSNELRWTTGMTADGQWQSGCEGFLKEARKMAKISTIPEIVSVRETFNENNTAYIVMDYVEGITLKNFLEKNGPMKFSDCVNLLLPLMNGLDKVHQQGLIHRDISPDNIMLQPDGRLRLLDLGAAKDLSVGNQAASQLVAKHGFSPLEQYMEKGGIGPWTDVYALCATIYYCVTGKLVPDAPDRLESEVLNFTIEGREPLSKQQMAILSAGLALKKEKRTQSVSLLVEQLKGNVSPSKPSFSPKWLVAGIGIVAVLAGGGLWYGNFAAQRVKIAGTGYRTGQKALSARGERTVAQVEALGCSNANLLGGANYAEIFNQYAYYADKNWNFYVSPYDQEASKFWVGVDDIPIVDDEVGYINIGANKVYFIHDETDESGNSDSLMQMDFDGSNVETLISDGTYREMQYVRLTDGREYLYYLKEDDNPKDFQYILCRYNLDQRGSEELLLEGIHWFNLDGKHLYYITISEENGYESVWGRARLDGKGAEVLNDSDNLVYGYIEDGTAYLFSWKEEVMYGYTLEGEKTGDCLVIGNGCSVYGDGWIYYSKEDSNEVHRVRPDGTNDTIIFEGYNIMEMCYDNSWLWMIQSKRVNDEYVHQQTYLVLKDGSSVITIEDTYIDTMPAGLEYRIEDEKLILVDYTGADSRIVIPWVVDEKTITDISRGGTFPEEVDIYVYPQEKELTYELTEDKTGAVLTGCGGGLTEGYPFLAMPDTVDGLPLVKLGDELFRDNTTLQGIILPEGLEEIGEFVFFGCTNLSYVRLPDTIKRIGTSAFMGSGLAEIILPEGLERIEAYAFMLTKLKEVRLPSTLTLAGNPFANYDLNAITLAEGQKDYYMSDGAVYWDATSTIRIVPARMWGVFTVLDGTQSVGSDAFFGTNITEVYLPESITEIYSGAFRYAEKLKTVHMEEGVKTIENSAFYGCKALQDITIPRSVKKIGSKAFEGCTSLRSVTISRDCNVAEDAFEGTIQINYY